ncbi:hypothetical protein Dsin_009506 [Dipteronia sinensis]|uniref:NPH3 domain-containing protein n=1 Tax=Dipteronia sinensis TaxID=43782 RepID=A0AAE0AQT2_9ROSI|nr:hypothetical protein Dsin_009506 [Dipteronia sinensis]
MQNLLQNNNSLILTKFLLHYLKRSKTTTSKSESYGGLANTAVNGSHLCWLLWALRVVGSGFGLSKECRACLEKKIGEMLDEATLDDLMVSAVYQILPEIALMGCIELQPTDIYLQSHPRLSLEERSKLCRCLNYEKLSLEACKELAKNPKITIEALISQHSEGRNDENMSLGRMQSRVVALEEACGASDASCSCSTHHYSLFNFSNKFLLIIISIILENL